MLLALALCGVQASLGAVFSADLDAEIAALHSFMEESWGRVSNLTSELQSLGAIAPAGGDGLPGARLQDNKGSGGMGPALGPKLTIPGSLQTGASSAGIHLSPNGGGGALQDAGAPRSQNRVAPEKLNALRKLQAEFAELQRRAFRIGRESHDNSELSKHPDMNNYIQNMREFKPRLQDAISDLEKEWAKVTGKKITQPKKSKKSSTKTIQGLSEKGIRQQIRKRMSDDSRPFRTRAMDSVSLFRERQMQMQDKQQDLQREMEGPDWPKEDWPLSTADAKNVGEAEHMISGALKTLSSRIDKFGGLPQVHEMGDNEVLEQLAVLGEMMRGYCDLIDQHVTTVKTATGGASRKKKKKKASATAGSAAANAAQGASLRDKLLNFGNTPTEQQPFAWLRQQESAGGAGQQSASQLGTTSQPRMSMPGAGLGTSTAAPAGIHAGFGGIGAFGGSGSPMNSAGNAGIEPNMGNNRGRESVGSASLGTSPGSFNSGGFGFNSGGFGFNSGISDRPAFAGFGGNPGVPGGHDKLGLKPSCNTFPGLSGGAAFGSQPSGQVLGGGATFGSQHPQQGLGTGAMFSNQQSGQGLGGGASFGSQHPGPGLGGGAAFGSQRPGPGLGGGAAFGTHPSGQGLGGGAAFGSHRAGEGLGNSAAFGSQQPGQGFGVGATFGGQHPGQGLGGGTAFGSPHPGQGAGPQAVPTYGFSRGRAEL